MTDEFSLRHISRVVEEWGRDKGLHNNPSAQLEKLLEEVGELARAHSSIVGLTANGYTPRDDNVAVEREELKDAIGDTAVVLHQLAAGHDLTFEECLRHAWNEVKDREGTVQEGVFVKEADQ